MGESGRRRRRQNFPPPPVNMSSGRYMAYSRSPSAPHSPHIGGLRSASSALADQEKCVSPFSLQLPFYMYINLKSSSLWIHVVIYLLVDRAELD